MLLTHPLQKCLPGGGDAPCIPEPEENNLSSAAGQGQRPFGGRALLVRVPRPPGQPQWWAQHHGEGSGDQREMDPPSFTDPETPSLKVELNIHSLRTWGLLFEV